MQHLGRARAPAHAVSAPVRARVRGRTHHGRQRAHRDGHWRLRDHTELGVARPRKHHGRSDFLARRTRHPAGAVPRRLVCGAPGRGRAARGQARRRQPRALRREHAPGRLREEDADLADLQLSLRAQPRRARADAAQRAMGSVSRPQDALRQSGRRRVGDADDRRVPAAPAARAHDDAVPLDRCDRLRSGRGQRSVAGGRTFEWTPRDVFVVPSWCPVHHEPCEDAVLFSYSDRPVQEKLGLWRERRGNEQGSPSP